MSAQPAEVPVGPFRVLDESASSVVERMVRLATTVGRESVVTCFALHVGGLNHRRNAEYVAAMSRADVVYADGGSVVLLAKLAGATHVERAPTTDLGWEVLARLKDTLGAPPAVALVGCEPGVVDRVAEVFREGEIAEPILVEHGYHTDWAPVVSRLRELRPMVTFVGLGCPGEMLWTQKWRGQLGAGTVITCGGWFRFIAGEERRAPRLLRYPGVEWLARLTQSPGRLGPRYAQGAISTVALLPMALQLRRATAGRRH